MLSKMLTSVDPNVDYPRNTFALVPKAIAQNVDLLSPYIYIKKYIIYIYLRSQQVNKMLSPYSRVNENVATLVNI